MLGARASCKLAWSAWSAGNRCPGPAGPLAGLRSKIGFPRCSPVPVGWRRGRNDRRFIDRPRPGLRHHHAARQRAQLASRLFAAVRTRPLYPAQRLAVPTTAVLPPACGAAADLCRHGCCRSFGNGCSDGCWCLNGDLFFARSRSCRRLYHHASRRRCNDNNRARGNSPRGGLGDNCADGRTRGNSWGGGGGVTMGGAERGCGTILRGSGRAGAAAAGFAATGATAAGTTALAGAAAGGFAGTRGWRASSSSSFFLARMAFSTSPGLEMCERSILGATVSAPWRVCPPPACDAVFASCTKCARTFSASSAQASWSASCPQKRRAPEERRESPET